MRNSLAESNPDFTFNVIDDKQIQMMSKANYPATATPFKGQVYFSKQFSLVDVRDDYKSKGIYTVEQVNDNTLFVDSKDGYSFSVKLNDYNDYVLFSLTERKN